MVAALSSLDTVRRARRLGAIVCARRRRAVTWRGLSDNLVRVFDFLLITMHSSIDDRLLRRKQVDNWGR